MSINPKTPCYPQDKRNLDYIVWGAVVVAILGALATLWVLYDAWTIKRVVLLYITIGLWAVVPPCWFWLEYFCFYRRHGQPDTLELFKYGQDVAKAIWAGVLAGLIAFAASDATTPPPQKVRQSPQQATPGPSDGMEPRGSRSAK